MTHRYRGRFRLVAAAFLVVSALALVAFPGAPALAQAPLQATPQTVAAFMQWYQSQPRVSLPVSAAGAAVVVVRFSDYECPACGLTHKAYKPIFEKYQAQFPGAIRQIEKDFPLDVACNPLLKSPIHEASCDAAVAVLLAQRHNKGSVVADWFFDNQDLLTHATVRRTAELLGDVTDFTAAYAGAIETVKADVRLGLSLNVNSTPTFFINGVKVAQVMPPDFFEAALQYELRRAGKIK